MEEGGAVIPKNELQSNTPETRQIAFNLKYRTS